TRLGGVTATDVARAAAVAGGPATVSALLEQGTYRLAVSGQAVGGVLLPGGLAYHLLTASPPASGPFEALATARNEVDRGRQQVAEADLNGDGLRDLVVTGEAGDARTVSVRLGNGAGTFQPRGAAGGGRTLQVGPSAYSANLIGNPRIELPFGGIVTADLNGDGRLDLAVTGNDLPDPLTPTNTAAALYVFLGD